MKNKIYFRISVLVIAFMVSGLSGVNAALAVHTSTATVVPNIVAGESNNRLTFTIVKENGEDDIVALAINSGNAFEINTDSDSAICPEDWEKEVYSFYVQCRFVGSGQPIATSGQIFFEAAAPYPSNDSIYEWGVVTLDATYDGGGEGRYYPPAPQIVVDVTAPSVTGYTLNGNEADAFFNPQNSDSVEITVNASEDVKFTRIYICPMDVVECNQDSAVKYFSQNYFDDTVTKYWNGKNADGEFVADGEYKLKVRIRDRADIFTETDLAPYVIVIDTTPPVVSENALVAPSEPGIEIRGGSEYEIAWDNAGILDENLREVPIKLEFSPLGDFSDSVVISENEVNDGSYLWAVPNIDTSAAKIRITVSDLAGNFASDESDNPFAINSTPSLIILSGANSVDLTVGDSFTDVDISQATRAVNVVAVPPAPTPVIIVPSGGGGGGGYYVPPVTPPPIFPAIPQILGAATFNFASDLGIGMSGNAVTELQKRLITESVYSGPITGYFGSLTLAGVKNYQAKHDINQTGFVGPLTRAKLNGN